MKPVAAEVKIAFKSPPVAAVIKPEAAAPAAPAERPNPVMPKAPGPRTMPNATVPKMRPTGLFSTFLTTLATRLKVLPTALNIFLIKNSGRPVLGLMVPEPPRAISIRASLGVMCASMVSPRRPLLATICAASAIPPRAKP